MMSTCLTIENTWIGFYAGFPPGAPHTRVCFLGYHVNPLLQQEVFTEVFPTTYPKKGIWIASCCFLLHELYPSKSPR